MRQKELLPSRQLPNTMTDKEEVRVNTIDAEIASLNGSSVASMSPGNGDDKPREGGDESTVEKGVAPVSAPVEEVSHPASARNWSKKKKWNITLVASAFGFIAPMGTSMLAPALPAMGMDLGISDQTTQLIILTIFVLAYAFGPLLLGPLAEIYGRIWVMQGASLMCPHLPPGLRICSEQGANAGFSVLRRFWRLRASSPLRGNGGGLFLST